ncbi:glucose-6-phosphate dehydrogenase (NADP(+)) [Patescibacteria group bacterium]|nr:glucose-6-phosphate dehydrogenase (NADP(+)) [Patescibacteria group bacterium]MBU1123478.1 glucose-6-phosphate dehydrogenase (NADP(+)) [Patescibacteria group bacterium]MBU1910799.1 glucose-6-phosphate dehydrogenase (NADP(+)) [Patescibacteria group bacterium]
MPLSTSHPFSLIIFGASGHLAKLKLYPELYILELKERLPKDYSIVGFSRTEMSEDEFKKLVEDSVRENMPAVNEEVLKKFLDHISYHQGQYSDEADFKSLNEKLESLEENSNDLVRLAYFSVPPDAFGNIAHNLCKGGVHNPTIPLGRAKSRPFRCIVEKPVGHDLKTFQEIKKGLIGCFKEEEIFLLDHYLGKEAVRNIFYLRYANPILEKLLDSKLIHHIEITAFEEAGLDGRAGYFEHTGTFRDMFQSHLLMMASLLTMELVEKDESMLKSRLDALKQFYLPPSSDLSDVVMQAQYDSYKQEDGTAPDSRTNTFCALKLLTSAGEYQGVPFYLRSGKRLKKKETRITVAFKKGPNGTEGICENCLDIILQGEAGMKVHLQTKMGGTVPKFRPLILEDPLVCTGDCLPEHSLLILEAIAGSRLWFLTFDEVQAAWRLIDPLQSYLDDPETELHLYKAGSGGVEAAEEWVRRDGVRWM